MNLVTTTREFIKLWRTRTPMPVPQDLQQPRLHHLAMETFAQDWWDRHTWQHKANILNRVGVTPAPQCRWALLSSSEKLAWAATLFETNVLVVCRCIPCEWCEGTGEEGYYEARPAGIKIPCTECKGTMTNPGECPVHRIEGEPGRLVECCAEYHLGEHEAGCHNYPRPR